MSGIEIFPVGENALTIRFSEEIDPATNRLVIGLARYFEKNPFPGLIEPVPAYSSLTLFYDLCEVRKTVPGFSSAFQAVEFFVQKALTQVEARPAEEARLVEIPVSFAAAHALDLGLVAARAHMSPEEVIERFIARTYRVYLIGFLPGFAYMGEIDEKIAAPRRADPRLRVPPGSVGIAGRQTGVYPLASPGGWQIIGHTETQFFTPDRAVPVLLQAGDRVKFIRI